MVIKFVHNKFCFDGVSHKFELPIFVYSSAHNQPLGSTTDPNLGGFSISPHILRIYYRRFIRLKPFISKRKMIKTGYVDYIKFKFKYENYDLKRKYVLPQVKHPTLTPKLFLERLTNSYSFIYKTCVYLDPLRTVKDGEHSMLKDNLYCKRVLKNILTTEFMKNSLIKKSPSEFYPIFRKHFNYLQQDNGITENSTDKKKLQEIKKSLKYTNIAEFDFCLILLNEQLNTML
ncbi:Irc19p SCDLUD_001351 [Saccharomycodes ludwigii]|uniref:Irc19p n=1 Tax=Saccharomycodes ludwigii TaxID=36035 RepID=UPI001E83E1FF|nr:hypothetical protein SCDLUD_001351 [Saccharomycodes ludwigii]KAH3901588.1 hypothetical protein SCDLUD_001351 [Saccharomycodes ludwigii]